MFASCRVESDSATIAEALTWARESLTEAEVPNPAVNAERMLEDLLGVSRAELYLHRVQSLSEAQRAKLEHWVQERTAGKPLQYLLGHAGFYGLDLVVEEGVFIPRPETERLVEEVLGKIENSKLKNEKINFVDIGTGCGAIAVSIAVCLPGAQGVATDSSELALRVAGRNVRRYGVGEQIRFERCDLFPLESERFDLIVSNPPYIPTAMISELSVEVKDFEPYEALDGGPDGLRWIQEIIPKAKEHLDLDGLLALEVGEGQAGRVVSLMQEAGYESIEVEEDLCGMERVVMGRNLRSEE